MLWNVEFLVPRYGPWWTRLALYVMLWNVPRYAERGNRNSTLCITWKKKASHVALRIHKYGEGTIRVGVTDDAVYCFKGWLNHYGTWSMDEEIWLCSRRIRQRSRALCSHSSLEGQWINGTAHFFDIKQTTHCIATKFEIHIRNHNVVQGILRSIA